MKLISLRHKQEELFSHSASRKVVAPGIYVFSRFAVLVEQLRIRLKGVGLRRNIVAQLMNIGSEKNIVKQRSADRNSMPSISLHSALFFPSTLGKKHCIMNRKCENRGKKNTTT